jgi:hypothetical protein
LARLTKALGAGGAMTYDTTKVEEAVLGLLGVFEFENGRVWKRFDFDVMDSLLSSTQS